MKMQHLALLLILTIWIDDLIMRWMVLKTENKNFLNEVGTQS